MNKSDLIRSVSVNNAMSYEKAELAVNQFFAAMAQSMKEGHGVELRGFGSFRVKDYEGYMGRNPRTGEAVSVAPKRMPAFKVGKEMKELVND